MKSLFTIALLTFALAGSAFASDMTCTKDRLLQKTVCKFSDGFVVAVEHNGDQLSVTSHNEVEDGVKASSLRSFLDSIPTEADKKRLAELFVRISEMPDSASKTIQLDHLKCDECLGQDYKNIRMAEREPGMKSALKDMCKQSYYADRHPVVCQTEVK